jgi:asparagine synthase (glutamine-hydrolysing)
MCGIAGIFNLNGVAIAPSILRQMVDTISYRGPDGEGFFIDGNIAIGHKRLAILDPSSNAAQPMFSKDGDWVIAFNGCIYNFKELRHELRAKGHQFFSSGDTEVIAEGLSSSGISFCERLNGMFAVAAWHKPTNTIYLSRDRYGIKPLYYWFNGKSFVFASEIKAILKHPDYSIDIDYNALNQYFTFQNVFTYNTLFSGINILPPGNTIKINTETSAIRRYPWWDFDFLSPDENMSFDDAIIETRRLLRNAVTRQLVSDVPIGSYLSGGIDSGSITAYASTHLGQLSTFTCGFDMSEVTGIEANYDERRDAQLMANYFKTQHYEQVIHAGDLSLSLPQVVWHIEDLRVGMSYPNYYISRLASKFVKVCFQGTGGDELFGGYPWRYYKVLGSIDKEEYLKQYYSYWQRLVPDTDREELFSPEVLKRMDRELPWQAFRNVFTLNDKLSYNTPEQQIQNSLYFEIKTFLPALLLIGDKLSMANGLEERFPFLDNDLVNFAQKIPVKHKLGNFEKIKRIDENELKAKRQIYQELNEGKNVLRKAMEEFIPQKILNRRKQGFSAPDESWYRGENASYVKNLLLNQKTISTEFINRDYIEKIIHEHISERINHRLLIWSFMNFEWWCRLFLKGEKINHQ